MGNCCPSIPDDFICECGEHSNSEFHRTHSGHECPHYRTRNAAVNENPPEVRWKCTLAKCLGDRISYTTKEGLEAHVDAVHRNAS